MIFAAFLSCQVPADRNAAFLTFGFFSAIPSALEVKDLVERTLWNQLVGLFHIALKRCLQLAAEANRVCFTTSLIRPLSAQPCRLSVGGAADTGGAQCPAPTADIKVVASGWLTLFAGEAVGELAAVVSKQLTHSSSAPRVPAGLKVHAALLTLVLAEHMMNTQRVARSMATNR